VIEAVILLNTALDSQNKVLENLKSVDGVQEAHALFGLYDFLVKIQSPTIDQLKEITRSKIKQITGVNSTLTLMINNHTL
jgi:DNA-binding Lrp family transcriptional regulator